MMGSTRVDEFKLSSITLRLEITLTSAIQRNTMSWLWLLALGAGCANLSTAKANFAYIVSRAIT